MPYTVTAYKVMIASPGDVPKERQIARDVIQEWNSIHSDDKKIVLMPVGWETHSSPEVGDRPQAIINKQILAGADLLIAIFWTRLGSPTGNSASGTVEEIEEHVKAGKPVMLYFSSAPVRLESVHEKQYKALLKFKEEYKKKGLIQEYESLTEFREKLARQLAQTVIRTPFFLQGRPPRKSPDKIIRARARVPDISPDAIAMLLEASADQQGTILLVRHFEGLSVQTNGKDLVTRQDTRTQARWSAAVDELKNARLIQELGHKGEEFQVTDFGYGIADLVRSYDIDAKVLA